MYTVFHNNLLGGNHDPKSRYFTSDTYLHCTCIQIMKSETYVDYYRLATLNSYNFTSIGMYIHCIYTLKTIIVIECADNYCTIEWQLASFPVLHHSYRRLQYDDSCGGGLGTRLSGSHICRKGALCFKFYPSPTISHSQKITYK